MTVMSNESALLGHVVSQIETNIQFLISQNYLNQGDAAAFLSKLSNVRSRTGPTILAPPPAALSAPSTLPKAKAMWAYNENSADPEDLSFAAGDIIEIVEETNADWWMGRCNGKQALFPSAYVEKIREAPAAPRAPVPTPTPAARPAYKPFRAAYAGTPGHAPPPPTAPVVSPVNSLGLQQDVAGQEAKKSKYGKYGDTMAHSAAGGVGFGVGSAVGGGLVRAIF